MAWFGDDGICINYKNSPLVTTSELNHEMFLKLDSIIC